MQAIESVPKPAFKATNKEEDNVNTTKKDDQNGTIVKLEGFFGDLFRIEQMCK